MGHKITTVLHKTLLNWIVKQKDKQELDHPVDKAVINDIHIPAFEEDCRKLK